MTGDWSVVLENALQRRSCALMDFGLHNIRHLPWQAMSPTMYGLGQYFRWFAHRTGVGAEGIRRRLNYEGVVDIGVSSTVERLAFVAYPIRDDLRIPPP